MPQGLRDAMAASRRVIVACVAMLALVAWPADPQEGPLQGGVRELGILVNDGRALSNDALRKAAVRENNLSVTALSTINLPGSVTVTFGRFLNDGDGTASVDQFDRATRAATVFVPDPDQLARVIRDLASRGRLNGDIELRAWSDGLKNSSRGSGGYLEVLKQGADGKHSEGTIPLSGRVRVVDIRDQLGPLWSEDQKLLFPRLREYWTSIADKSPREAKLMLERRLDQVARRIDVLGVSIRGDAVPIVGAMVVALLLFSLLAELKTVADVNDGELRKTLSGSSWWLTHRSGLIRRTATVLVTILPLLAIGGPALRTRDVVTWGILGTIGAGGMFLAFMTWHTLRDVGRRAYGQSLSVKSQAA